MSYAWIGAANSFGDIGAAWGTIVARTLASIPSHWMFSGVFGAGLIGSSAGPMRARKGLGAGLMLTAMCFHGLWNASGAIGGDSVFAWIVPAIVAGTLISVFIWVYRRSVRSSASGCADLMTPEVKRGVVTPAELDALAGSRSTFRKYIRSQPSRQRAEHVLEAETDLAHQIARDDGAESAGVQRARTAVAQARGV